MAIVATGKNVYVFSFEGHDVVKDGHDMASQLWPFWFCDAGPSVEDQALVFLEAYDRVAKGVSQKWP